MSFQVLAKAVDERYEVLDTLINYRIMLLPDAEESQTRELFYSSLTVMRGEYRASKAAVDGELPAFIEAYRMQTFAAFSRVRDNTLKLTARIDALQHHVDEVERYSPRASVVLSPVEEAERQKNYDKAFANLKRVWRTPLRS